MEVSDVHHKALWTLTKRANKGFRGYPIGTVAFYGPDDRRASKVAVGVVSREGAEPAELERWFSDEGDVRDDIDVTTAITAFLERHRVKSVVLADRILGCPHEEGIDYPRGEKCPACPFWASRDRWTGERLN